MRIEELLRDVEDKRYFGFFFCGLPRWLRGKESACQADVVLIPGSVRSPGEGNGNILHYSCLGNPLDEGAQWATTQLSGHTHTHTISMTGHQLQLQLPKHSAQLTIPG